MNDEDRISQAREDARRKYAESQEPPKKKEPRDWQAIIDEQAAQIDINTLPGKGKPLNLNRNPYADEADELANSLLKNAGFTLPWIEDSRKIDAELAAARAKLVRARDEYHEMRDAQICAGQQWVEGSWQAALREFCGRPAQQFVGTEAGERGTGDAEGQIRLAAAGSFGGLGLLGLDTAL